jgi:hypothetical protein
MNDEIKKKIINIESVSTIKKKGTETIIGYNLFENEKTKYALFLTKQDGGETKAYSQFKSQGLMAGSSVGIAFKETPNDYEYKDKKTGEMKTAHGINRTIAWLSEPNSIEEYSGKPENVAADGVFFGTPNKPEEETIDVAKIPF